VCVNITVKYMMRKTLKNATAFVGSKADALYVVSSTETSRTPRNTGCRVSRNLVRPAGCLFSGACRCCRAGDGDDVELQLADSLLPGSLFSTHILLLQLSRSLRFRT
jgi:hypothetical protein